jgi:hypothetical protein
MHFRILNGFLEFLTRKKELKKQEQYWADISAQGFSPVGKSWPAGPLYWHHVGATMSGHHAPMLTVVQQGWAHRWRDQGGVFTRNTRETGSWPGKVTVVEAHRGGRSSMRGRRWWCAVAVHCRRWSDVVLRHQWREGSEGTTTNQRQIKCGMSSPRRGKNGDSGFNPDGFLVTGLGHEAAGMGGGVGWGESPSVAPHSILWGRAPGPTDGRPTMD